MFPLGRYIAMDAKKDVSTRMDGAQVKYLLQPPECGDESETHTVREWLSGFDTLEQSVNDTVKTIRNHPLSPHDIRIGGYVINTETGELQVIC